MSPDLLIRAEAQQLLHMPWWQRSTQWAQQPELARLSELLEMGDHRIAARIAKCGQPIITKTQGKLIAAPCNRRECLKCVADRIYPTFRNRIADGARRMVNPLSIRFSVASEGEDDLDSALGLLRTSLRKLQRLRSMRDVLRGVGLIHPDHARKGRWHPHVHLLIDAPANFSLEAVQKDWKRLTAGWVQLRPVQKKGASYEDGDPSDTDAAANYIANSSSWSPENGELPIGQYAQLRKAIEGRQLLVSWGLSRRGKAKRTTSLQARCEEAAVLAERQHRLEVSEEYDRVEECNAVMITSLFKLEDGYSTSPHRVVRGLVEPGEKLSDAIERACIIFLSMAIRADEAGLDRVLEMISSWLGITLVPTSVRSPRKTSTHGTRLTLSAGPPAPRHPASRPTTFVAPPSMHGSRHGFLFEALGHAMVMTSLNSTGALEFIAAVAMAERLDTNPFAEIIVTEQRSLVLASVLRLFGMAPVEA